MMTNAVLFGTAVLLDTLGTTLFKLGADRQAARTSSTPAGWAAVGPFLKQHLWSCWHIPAGLAVYVLEYILWITYLSTAALSQAFPMYSMTIVSVLLVSRFFLKEQVGINRWLGAAMIIAGVILLGGQA